MTDDTARYPAHVFWSDEDQEFVAIATDLPGSSGFGSTREEAIAALNDVIKLWLEAARAAGNPIPEPSKQPTESEYSGKLLLRMPKALHAQLAPTAKAENVSLNSFVVYLITDALARYTDRNSQECIDAAVKVLDSAEVHNTIYTHDTQPQHLLTCVQLVTDSPFGETMDHLCEYWEPAASSTSQQLTPMRLHDAPLWSMPHNLQTAIRRN